MANSTGIKTLRKWKRILSAGHPGVLRRRHVRGDRTSVSHAATVRVQTKKYLCAERWGGRLREGGSWVRDMVSAIKDGKKKIIYLFISQFCPFIYLYFDLFYSFFFLALFRKWQYVTTSIFAMVAWWLVKDFHVQFSRIRLDTVVVSTPLCLIQSLPVSVSSKTQFHTDHVPGSPSSRLSSSFLSYLLS